MGASLSFDLSGFQGADVPTPLGVFRMGYRDEEVAFVDLRERGIHQSGFVVPGRVERPPFPRDSPPDQLTRYFRGELKEFHVTLTFPSGGPFAQKVWAELARIPFGSYRTYGDVAKRIGRPGAARAVGGAARQNPIPIIVPCHRLVGSDRSLTGFGMGLWRKRWLLRHEGIYPLPRRPGDPSRRLRQTTLFSSPTE